MAVFVRAPIILVRAALPQMKARGFGRIVNNTTSYITMLRVLPYGAAKAALESMSAVWAKELDGGPVTVNVLVPGGPTDTPFIAPESGWPRDKMLRPDDHGAADPLAYVGRCRHIQRPAHHRRALGRSTAAGGRGQARQPRHRLAGARRRCGVAHGLSR